MANQKKKTRPVPKASDRYKPRTDGRYLTYVGTHKYLPDGKPERIAVYADSSKELEKKVADLRYEIDHAVYVNSKGLLFKAYAEKWLSVYKAHKELNTIKMYQNIISHHLGYLGDCQIKDITKSDIQQLINSQADMPRTCEQIRLTISQVLECAVEDGLINKNVCNNIQLPKNQATEKRALTKEEKDAISNAEFTIREKAFVYILYFCGLRRGEALALTRQDIDFKSQVLSVTKSLLFDENDPVPKCPKSEAGIRKIDMPDTLTDFLKDYIKTVDLLLFTSSDGGQITKSSYRRMWQSIDQKINHYIFEHTGRGYRPPTVKLTAHIFRHNYCTLLYYSGISLKKAVQLMGHSDSKMIMNIYAHLDDEKEMTKEKINKIIAL